MLSIAGGIGTTAGTWLDAIGTYGQTLPAAANEAFITGCLTITAMDRVVVPIHLAAVGTTGFAIEVAQDTVNNQALSAATTSHRMGQVTRRSGRAMRPIQEAVGRQATEAGVGGM